MATKSLYVGNLPYSTTEVHLVDLFAPYGARSARIIEGRGFGFVDVDEEHAQAAISALDQSDLGGRTIRVSEAKPREERRENDRYRSRGNFSGRSRGRGR